MDVLCIVLKGVYKFCFCYEHICKVLRPNVYITLDWFAIQWDIAQVNLELIL